MGRFADLDRRLANAPEEVRQQAELLTDQISRLLGQAEDDDVWDGLIGPAYTTDQVPELLGVTRHAVGQCSGLLRLEQRDGAAVYPVFPVQRFDRAARHPTGGSRAHPGGLLTAGRLRRGC